MENRHLIQITSGRGPVECCRIVSLVCNKISNWCVLQNYGCEVVEAVDGPENGTLSSAVLAVDGADAETLVNEWEGTVLWVAQSKYRPHHKRKNWFVGVKVYDLPTLLEADTSRFVYESLRASGPGGQHVNKTESAVRVYDPQSGLSVVAMDQRNQLQNKKLATERLLLKLEERNQEAAMEGQQQNWNNHNSLLRGNPIKTYREKM